MRNVEDILEIKKDLIAPYSINQCISKEDISHLVNLFQTSNTNNSFYHKVYKNTGPVTLDLKLFITDHVVKKILKFIENEIGQYEITAAFFFRTDYPHIIHNDDTYELPKSVYRGITIPLELEGSYTEYPYLCFFDQMYFHGPSKFFLKDKDIPTYYNQQVYDYSNVDGIVETGFDDSLYFKYFTHCKKQWLTGLTLNSIIEWKPGNLIIFDSVRLHCASDFRKLGIKSKLGISIFTKK